MSQFAASSSQTAPLISLSRVDKRFATGTLALQGIDLQVRAGEFLTLLGPSGCGKSTVLRMMAGLDAPSSGQVQAPALTHPGTANTAFVFQDPTLMPWATVFDNVWLPLRIGGVSRTQAAPRVLPVLQRLGLADFANAYPAELSGGMRMRASIARALVTQPQVLLMDEPFAALDEITRHRLNTELLAWWRLQPMAVVFVTHSVHEAVFLSQRVAVMGARPGRVVAQHRIDGPDMRDSAWRSDPVFVHHTQHLSRQLEAAHAEGST